MNITADQIEDLYNHGGELELPNGDTLTRDALTQYIDACDIDTDDDGTPLDSQWEILADVLGAPDPANMPELVDVIASTNTVQEATEYPYVAVLRDYHGNISIEIQDVNGPEDLDTTSYVAQGDIATHTDGLTNRPILKMNALNWLRENGWETIGDRTDIVYGNAWPVTEPLPVRPAATDDLSRVAVAASRIGQAEEARDEAIRTALAAGHAVTAIAEKANLSRARIYQIRDGRR
jgi:hypothetical protein